MDLLFDLTGKVALITGGSRGLGLQMAEALGEMGCRLAITARKQAELDEAAAHLDKMGIEVMTVAGDMSKFDSVPAPQDWTVALPLVVVVLGLTCATSEL